MRTRSLSPRSPSTGTVLAGLNPPACSWARTLAGPLTLVALVLIAGCKDDNKRDTPPPGAGGSSAPTSQGSHAGPPPTASAQAAACRDADVTDALSAGFFTRKVSGFCLDPDAKTYGDRGKFTAAEICTTGFDGGCEVYADYGRKRLVIAHYNEEAGKGANVEVNLWQFENAHGAYGMFTKNVVGEQDPTDKATARVLEAGSAGAIGTGRVYVWKGEYLIELVYNSENESPEALAASSAKVLPAIGKAIADKLPNSLGSARKLAAVSLLPEKNLVPNGVLYLPKALPKHPLGLPNLGNIAMGYYKNGESRYRAMAIAYDNVEQAKDAFKTLKGRNAKPVTETGLGDEAAHISTGGSKDSPRTDWLLARKGVNLVAIGDEEFALRAAGAKADGARVAKDFALTELRSWIASPAAAASAQPAGTTSAPAGSTSAAPKH